MELDIFEKNRHLKNIYTFLKKIDLFEKIRHFEKN